MAVRGAMDDTRNPDLAPTWTEIGEEAASQGYKTGHMRWVLAIGLALACAAVGFIAAFHF